MRSPLRTGLVTGVSLTMLLTLGFAAPELAYADDTTPVPTQEQVTQARENVAQKAQSVASIQAEMDAAKGQFEAAQLAASVASEDYNGAMWELSESRKASKAAAATAARLHEQVGVQRDGMARLVVHSYQVGTQLNAMTAILDADGPRAIMGRQAVVEMAGNSITARMESFKKSSKAAVTAQAKAQAAAAQRATLAEDAKTARDAAVSAVSSATAIQGQIAQKRNALVAELARSQNISIGLASQRQQALEAVAEQKSAAATAAHAASAAAAAQDQEAAEAAAQKARDDANKASKADDVAAPEPTQPDPEPVVDSNPPPEATGAQAAIAFARAQIGEPYRWGAAGPNSWDCSGLTMMAWAKGGKSLPHYSRAQFTAGTRISLSSVRPGDLYFWSSNGSPSGIHHVALATGGGNFIEAPRTGLNVRNNHISTWFPTYAVRL